MKKTQQELEEIKKQLDEITTKLKDLNEDEFKEVTGGRQEFVIKPIENNFWFCYNPSEVHTENEHYNLRGSASSSLKLDDNNK